MDAISEKAGLAMHRRRCADCQSLTRGGAIVVECGRCGWQDPRARGGRVLLYRGEDLLALIEVFMLSRRRKHPRHA